MSTPQQLKSRAYYLENKERFIENAQRYRREHPEEARRYQAEYYQRTKNSEGYLQRQNQKAVVRKEQAHLRAVAKAEVKAKKAEEEQRARAAMFVIERPPTPPPEIVDPELFTLKFL